MPRGTAATAGAGPLPACRGIIWAMPHSAETAPAKAANNNKCRCNRRFTNTPELRWIGKAVARPDARLSSRHRTFDRIDCLRNDGVDAGLAQLGAGTPRVPGHALAGAIDPGSSCGSQKLAANQAWIDGQRERSVREPCMGADFIIRVAALPQRFHVRDSGGAVG